MRDIKIKDIVIVGGGAAGWLAAIFLIKRKYNVTLIESKHIPSIGVGESIQPAVSGFLDFSGYNQTDWMPSANATYKMGTMFDGWSDNTFMVDSESAAFSILDTTEYDSYGTHDAAMALGMTANEWSNWFPPYRMAINNMSPKMGKERLNYLNGNMTPPPNAVQWDNVAIIDFLKQECLKQGVNHIVDKVVDANLDEEGYIKELILEDRTENISGDIYIDCSGFHSILFDVIYKCPWHSVQDFLPTNNAIAIRKKYTNPQKECHPYTKSTAMNSGWMWTIPTYNDLTYGYVYSDQYIDKDDAEHELRTKINEWDAPAKHVPFKSGIRDTIAFKNVYGMGLSAGFLEPLEATNLVFTVMAVGNLGKLLYETGNMYNENMGLHISKMFSASVDEIVNFIYMHYKMSTKDDTLFWKEVKEKPMPDKIVPIYNAIKDGPMSQVAFHDMMTKMMPGFRFTEPNAPIFASGHWWQLLKGCGRYENIKREYSDDFIKYGKMVLDVHSNRMDNVLKTFPNHYDYLTEWYESI
jgi:tryptophan halogenase